MGSGLWRGRGGGDDGMRFLDDTCTRGGGRGTGDGT